MILYINGNYPHHSLHGELVLKLADMGHAITVFVPMHGSEMNDKNRYEHPSVKIIYKDCIKTTDRVFFLRKIKRLTAIIEKEVDMTKVDCILAGTVYSDGFVAYELNKKYNIPFSVAVRETDVTYQMKWRPYLNNSVEYLLKKASRIIFLSPAYQAYLHKFHCSQQKFVIIPNAVNDYWFQNQGDYRELHNPVSLIYVGEITKRKNVTSTIRAVAELNQKGINAIFHIVGSGKEEEKCRSLAIELMVNEQVVFHGWQNDKGKMREYYNQADIFVMPSYRETFGTVYVEALSQGLPIVYSYGQGIDGYFMEGSVGYGCNPYSIVNITENIQKIINNFSSISHTCFYESHKFTWEAVATLYSTVIVETKKDRF